MRESVPSPRYSGICNVLRQWKTSLIPILIESTDSMTGDIVQQETCRIYYFCWPSLEDSLGNGS